MFAGSGVARDKLVVVAEPVSTAFFDPALAQPMPLPAGDLVFGGEPAAPAPADFAFLSVRGEPSASSGRCACSCAFRCVPLERSLTWVTCIRLHRGEHCTEYGFMLQSSAPEHEFMRHIYTCQQR